jgi:hypothetical protein
MSAVALLNKSGLSGSPCNTPLVSTISFVDGFLMCLIRLEGSLNQRPHLLHKNGFSPACIKMCLDRFDFKLDM